MSVRILSDWLEPADFIAPISSGWNTFGKVSAKTGAIHRKCGGAESISQAEENQLVSVEAVSMGVRCFKEKFEFVVLKGSQESIEVIAADTRVFPTDKAYSAQLVWIGQEVELLAKKYKPQYVVLRAIEPVSMGKYVQRAHVEGVVIERFCSLGVAVEAKAFASIAKDIKLGKSKKKEDLERFSQAKFTNVAKKYLEPAVSALSALPLDG
jgi:hypothetical protein